jgi:hypothetical protein
MMEVRAQLLHLHVHGIPPWQELMARDVLCIQLNFVHQYAEHNEISEKFNE